jgi:hypothetical protein
MCKKCLKRRSKRLPGRQMTMGDRHGSKSQDYVVGYRRPPKATKFMPGKSGNPGGRPKGSRSVGAILNGVIRQRITVTENGKTRRLTVLDVALRRLVNDAMRNDPRALKLLLSLVERYQDAPESELHLEKIVAEDRAILAQSAKIWRLCLRTHRRI